MFSLSETDLMECQFSVSSSVETASAASSDSASSSVGSSTSSQATNDGTTATNANMASRNEMLGSTIYLAGEKYDDGDWVEIDDAEPCPICSRMVKNSGIDKIVSKKGIFNLRD